MNKPLDNPLFEKYLKLLLKWNRTYNLTAIENPKEVRVKHFEDSLVPLPFLPKPCRLLDIGTGAGFPGIPLKIARPDLEIVLLDSVRKKTAFCEAAIRELKLDQIKVVQARAEDPNIAKKLGLFDVIISRATFSLTEFLEVASPFTKQGGLAIAMKGRDWQDEFKENKMWELKQSYDYTLSENYGDRTLVIFNRTSRP